jgi:SAM-dependent methyltransferase
MMQSTDTQPAEARHRQLVRDEWTDAATVAAWRRWHPKMTVQLQAMTDALLEAARVQPGMRILDLASGTGQPALDLARATGPTGQAIATDLSPAMLAVAEEHARAAGLANVAFHQADAEQLPFPDGSFDAVTSRLGAMYFVDVQRALGEIRRVLRPGGHVALAVWGPADQGTYLAAVLGPLFRRVPPPQPPPDAPTPFRFAGPGALGGELRRAGFGRVEERTTVVPAPWPGTPEEYWQQLYEVAVPLRPIFDSLPPAELAQARAEAADLLRAHYDGSTVRTSVAIVVASGTR